jgi:hypothetical protein
MDVDKKAAIGQVQRLLKAIIDRDKELILKVLEYEQLYFEDMQFLPGSIAGDAFVKRKRDKFLRQGKWKDRKNKKCFDCPETDPTSLISMFPCKIQRIAEGEHAEGVFHGLVGGITIDPKYNNQNVILHEMIHAYEWIIDNAAHHIKFPFRDILVMRLYDKIKNIMQPLDLDNQIMRFSRYNQKRRKSNMHSVLFFLKSLDLEIRTENGLGDISGFYIGKM